MRVRTVAVVLILGVVILGAALFVTSAGGFSARSEPTAAERIVARALRRWATPRQARTATNPVPFSSDAWAEARAHFADHCATCHANDGSGQTDIGRNLYPKAPDMRLAETERLTDGELYWIIENGIRLTGMPAWGQGGSDDADTWKLVHFIRHLKDLTPEQLAEMESLNPKSPADIQEEREDLDFLSGKDPERQATKGAHQHPKE
ncbi:MAG: c-type cytochrome [Acidobacteria bacterium]|nr:c-type cytochrome [Acidobacteriota bacterium]MBI3262152.1 c-type cytochrome [Acidobacteriota bacterium]